MNSFKRTKNVVGNGEKNNQCPTVKEEVVNGRKIENFLGFCCCGGDERRIRDGNFIYFFIVKVRRHKC